MNGQKQTAQTVSPEGRRKACPLLLRQVIYGCERACLRGGRHGRITRCSSAVRRPALARVLLVGEKPVLCWQKALEAFPGGWS